MKIEIQKALNAPRKGYEIIITTMEGDADDYHKRSFRFGVDEQQELRRYVIAAEVMKKTYSHGMGGDDRYEGEYWDLFKEDWPYECNSGFPDSMEEWEVIYHDGNGTVFPCTVTLEEVDKKEIEDAFPQDGGRPLLGNRKRAIDMLEACEDAFKEFSKGTPIRGLDESKREEVLQGWINAKPKYEEELRKAEEGLRKRGIPFETDMK